MAFAKKKINVTFELANGQFEGGGNKYVATGLRVSCNIVAAGGSSQVQASLAIFGLPLDVMNGLSNVGSKYGTALQNKLTVEAGDDVTGMQIVFKGDIFLAMVDATAMPQVVFLIKSMPGYFGKINPATPISIRGSADVAGMMSQIAGDLGMSFENNGVTAKLANPYYAGSLVQQAQSIARDAGITMIMERNTLAISKPGEPRKGDSVVISPQTGMISYPQFNQNEVVVRALFNPSLRYGGAIKIESDLTAANGTWTIRLIEYTLESEQPKGRWDVQISAVIAASTVA